MAASRPGKILLVDDDAAVRRVAARILREAGYEVLVAGHLGEARTHWATQGPGIDLLLTDVEMPDMSGADLAGELALQRPSIRVLYMSGRAVGPDPASAFLAKPFSPESLLESVQRVLEGSNR